METELLKLVYDYSAKGKLVDQKYIEKLIDIVVSSKLLNNYVCKFELLNDEQTFFENGMSLASYSPFSKTISIYINGVNQMLEHHDRYQVLFNSIEQIFYKNLLISQIILHELEHVNQRRIIDNEKSLESEILRLSSAKMDFDMGIKLIESGYSIEQVMIYILSKKTMRNENYRQNYLIAPEERLAEIKSYQEILGLLSHIKEYVPNLIQFEQTNKLENLLRGFDYNSGFLISPTISYLQQNGNAQSLNRFNWYDKDYFSCLEKAKANYSLDDRLKYGLMIDDKEFDSCLEYLKMSPKYNC